MHNLYGRLLDLGRGLRSRAFAASILFAAVAGLLLVLMGQVNTIRINDEGKTLLLHTTEQDPAVLLKDNGIATLSTDIVQFSGIQGGYGEINITRSFPIHVQADGRERTLFVTSGTVEDALNELGLSYDCNDILTPDPEKTLEKGEQIRLQRVDYQSRSEELAIPHETNTRPSPLLRAGQSLTLQAGSDGSKVLTYEQRTVDGQVEEETLVGEAQTKAPISTELLVGSPEATVSPLDFDLELDENGLPVHYNYVLTDQIATGYNMRRSVVRGASGLRLSAGYVAVRAEEIPYGTRLFIASADGSFVYGCAIAADTGSGLVDEVIDVDLYYDTYLESCLNGRKIVNIYVLD